VATRAIGVRTSTGQVWPWIARPDQGRGGFYRYDALQNLVGCDIHSGRPDHPELQGIQVGAEVRCTYRERGVL
jgi:hypothetical protein